MQLSIRRNLQSWLRLLVCLCVSAPALVLAQSEPILVVTGENVPDEISEGVGDALGDVGSVMNPSSYTSKARGRGQEPDSDEALTKLAPQAGASLIVVLQSARGKVKVELRNGRSGANVGKSSLPARGKHPKLGKPARKKLVAAAKRALKKIGPAPSKPAVSRSDDSFGDDDDPEDPAPQQPARAAAPATPKRQAPPPVAQAQRDEEEDEEEESFGSTSSDDEAAPPRDKAAAADDEGMRIRLHAGFGLGSRSIVVPTRPMSGLGNKVDTSWVPALDLGAGLDIPLGTAWMLRFLADYRTVLGLSVDYAPMPGMTATSSLSSHSLIAGASLGYLTDGRDSFGVHVVLGWAYRSLSAAEPSLPSAGIQGVVLRPELEIPISSINLTLRLAPELILVLSPSATLPMNDNGLAGATGFALGAEISADLRISKTVGISAQFRESRGSTPSGWGTPAVENERYFTLRLLLQF
jgi:hypothetical protein